MNKKIVGKVLWFDIKKGFGFIRFQEDGQPDMDYFAHYSKINAPDGEFRTLEKDEVVSFEPFYAERFDGNKKPQAKNIEKM